MWHRLGNQGPKRGLLAGPNPTVRCQPGSKTHLITDRSGLPLSQGISAANVDDSQGLVPLVLRACRQSGPACVRVAGDQKRHSDKGYATTIFADGSTVAAYTTASPTKASNPHSGSAATDGWSSERCPGRLSPSAPPLGAQARALLALVGIAALLIGQRRLTGSQ